MTLRRKITVGFFLLLILSGFAACGFTYYLYHYGLGLLPENKAPADPGNHNAKLLKMLWTYREDDRQIRLEPIGVIDYIEFFYYFENVPARHVFPKGSEVSKWAGHALALKSLLGNQPQMKQLDYTICDTSAIIWVSRNWSAEEALASIAEWSHYWPAGYGLEEGARMYFDKSSHELNKQESAIMIALMTGYMKFSPWCDSNGFLERTNKIISRYNAVYPEDRIKAFKQYPTSLKPKPAGLNCY